MGRHTATDDRSVHAGGEVGWPGEPNDGTGLGWPGDLPADDDEPAHSAAGGRRPLFGASPAP